MADTKLSALTAKTTAADADLFYLVDSATSPITSKGITYANLEARLRDATIITDLSTVTAAAGDYLLILDVSASPQALKKVLVSDLLDNATHTGDVTGSTALTIQPEAISGKGAVTASGSDYVLILDTSTSPNSLKKALVSDLGSAFGVSDITGAGAITVAGGDLLVAVDVSASPQVLGQVTAQAVADLFDASGYLPLSGGTLTGSIAFAASSPEHTVDGRNVSADGAKLDTIETNADVTDTANVTAAGALMDSEVTNLAAVKAFDPTDYATAAQGATADSALQNVSEDSTPQLGGSLDVNGQKIVSTSNGNIDIEPNGTGNVLLGNFTFDADQTVGVGQDNYVLTYDNASGLISLEAAAGGGGDLWSDAVDSDIVPTGADGTYDLGTTTDRFAQTYTDALWVTDGDFTTSVSDGASAIAAEFNNTVTLATAGAKLLSLKNNATEKFSVDKDGNIDIPSGAVIREASGNTLELDSVTSQLSFGYNDDFRISNGASAIQFIGNRTDIGGSYNGFAIWGLNQNTSLLVAGGAGTSDAASAAVEVRGGEAKSTNTTNIDGGPVFIVGGAGASGSAGDADGGHVYLDGGQGYGTGDHGDVIIGNTRGDLQFANAYTVATLPTGVVGKVARVTDASAPAVGSTVSGGGAAAALVWYNGSNWTVIGV